MREKNVPYKHLFQAARYTLLSGGKRVRPLLTLLITEMLGGDTDVALLPACCIEMIHTYSMIHDDLPCMDDDDFRRGKPTLHKVYNEGHAVLTGDYLLTLPFELISQDHRLTSHQKVDLIHILSSASGWRGLIGGQVVDLLNGPKSPDELRELHLQKTGALFIAAVDMGAVVAEATAEVRRKLRSFAESFGLAFQILNDILDVTSSEELRGTEISSDVKNGKVTYLTVMGYDGAVEELNVHRERCIEILEDLPYDSELLKQFTLDILTAKMRED